MLIAGGTGKRTQESFEAVEVITTHLRQVDGLDRAAVAADVLNVGELRMDVGCCRNCHLVPTIATGAAVSHHPQHVVEWRLSHPGDLTLSSCRCLVRGASLASTGLLACRHLL
ncbi:hypothetical protein ACHMW4_22145 [Mesorhizobium sp. UC22_110]|uniref:hypothetical protein n=1 Tax=unclassified Mesorhizobium TaxID=325217 RepID=UPI00366A9D80